MVWILQKPRDCTEKVGSVTFEGYIYSEKSDIVAQNTW